jgi:hypothetical protein
MLKNIKPLNLEIDFEMMQKYDTVLLPLEGRNAYYFPENNIILHPSILFVFGSNLAGRHGKGAALEASIDYGAIYGVGEGKMGRSYAIPTKNKMLHVLPLDEISKAVERFKEYIATSDTSCYVTAVGTGLAGYKHDDIAPMFKGVTNCWLPFEWRRFTEV